MKQARPNPSTTQLGYGKIPPLGSGELGCCGHHHGAEEGEGLKASHVQAARAKITAQIHFAVLPGRFGELFCH